MGDSSGSALGETGSTELAMVRSFIARRYPISSLVYSTSPSLVNVLCEEIRSLRTRASIDAMVWVLLITVLRETSDGSCAIISSLYFM